MLYLLFVRFRFTGQCQFVFWFLSFFLLTTVLFMVSVTFPMYSIKQIFFCFCLTLLNFIMRLCYLVRLPFPKYSHL